MATSMSETALKRRYLGKVDPPIDFFFMVEKPSLAEPTMKIMMSLLLMLNLVANASWRMCRLCHLV